MNFEEVFEQIENVEGWMGKTDCKALYDYVSQVEGLIVEIGSYMGRSTKLMAIASSKSQIITIDSFKDNAFSYMAGVEVKRRFNENVNGLSNVISIHKTSRAAARGWNKPIDFLLIDGDHLYEGVKSDIKLFAPHVKKGCYVFLHDYYVLEPGTEFRPFTHGVYKAVQELKHRYFDEVKHDIINYGFAICRRK